MISGKRVLITGGTGFIGSAVAQRLVGNNELLLLDLQTEKTPAHFTDLLEQDGVSVMQGDIRDLDTVRRACEGVDVVIHTAAVVGVHKVLGQPRLTIETNFTGTQNLLHAVRELDSLDRFVFLSTSEVFGGASFRADEAHHASIGTVQEARWSYSIAKLASEHLCYAYYREFDLPLVILRPFNVFGPRRTGDHAMLRFVLQSLRDEQIEVHGDGAQVRAWCYIDDFVDALIVTLDHPAAVGEDFNIGNPRNTLTIYDLAQRVIRLTESKSTIQFRDIDYSDIDIRVPKTKKARDLLGYEPKWEIDAAIKATADWYREHLDEFPSF
jgi:nucleoside-diphosphate-sugar epimerase